MSDQTAAPAAAPAAGPAPAPHRLGLLVDRELPPESLRAYAQAVDEGGADDLWVVEDLGWAGAVASAATALAATRRVRVGVGISPVPLRNPALLAMEVAALARLHPGRFVPGVGHGVQRWMEQVGVRPASPLTLLEESVQVLQALLRGGRVRFTGRAVTVDDVALVHPPAVAPPVVAAGVGARTLQLAGRVADGVLLVEGLGPAALGEALAHVRTGLAMRPDAAPFEVAALVHAHVGDDPVRVARVVAEVQEASASFLGVAPPEVHVVAGPAAHVVEGLRALHPLGVGTVVAHLWGDDHEAQARALLAAAR